MCKTSPEDNPINEYHTKVTMLPTTSLSSTVSYWELQRKQKDTKVIQIIVLTELISEIKLTLPGIC